MVMVSCLAWAWHFGCYEAGPHCWRPRVRLRLAISGPLSPPCTNPTWPLFRSACLPFLLSCLRSCELIPLPLPTGMLTPRLFACLPAHLPASLPPCRWSWLSSLAGRMRRGWARATDKEACRLRLLPQPQARGRYGWRQRRHMLQRRHLQRRRHLQGCHSQGRQLIRQQQVQGLTLVLQLCEQPCSCILA